jgi:hypothetical protein
MLSTRGLLVALPIAVCLGGCIDSGVDLSASLPPAFPILDGVYKSVSDPKTPPFKVIRSGSDYRAIDPTAPNGKGALFSLIDLDHNGIYLAEDKTSAKDVNPPRYVYYFVRIAPSGDRVDLYDFTKDDWRLLPAELKKRLKPGAGVTITDDADTAAILGEIDRRLAAEPTLTRTTFRLVRKLDAGQN